MKKRLLSVVLITILFIVSLCGCSKTAKNKIPYSDMTFENSLDDMIEVEGNNYETYDSIYEGLTYTYEKTYMDKTGTVKYMFNGDDSLMNIAWTYSGDNSDDIKELYDKIYNDIKDTYGDPSDAKGVNNYGAVWKRPDGNIIISAVASSQANVIQIAFLSPEVSKE